jgi:hypothetical protein
MEFHIMRVLQIASYTTISMGHFTIYMHVSSNYGLDSLHSGYLLSAQGLIHAWLLTRQEVDKRQVTVILKRLTVLISQLNDKTELTGPQFSNPHTHHHNT